MKLPDNFVKGLLAICWSLFVMWAIGYIIIQFGKEKEILTLIIGIISGTILGGIFGVYFADGLNKHNLPNPGTTSIDISATNVPVNDSESTEKKQAPTG